MLSEDEFEELVQYVSDNIEHDLDKYAMRMIGNHQPIPSELSSTIDDLAEEWCNDNGIDPDEYYGEYSAEDVFMHDAYDFGAK